LLKNYVYQNIEYLLTKSKLSQDDFGNLFDYKKGAFGQMLRRQAIPSVQIVQSICAHFKITIDDFVNRPLDEKAFNRERVLTTVDDRELPGTEPSKYTELLEKNLRDKDKLIEAYERELEVLRPAANKKNTGTA
jgi:transcriptional regulator with XRE-family HTH domain